eukprot:jgi/Chlat1/3878/Chrsp26S00303
MRARAGWWQGSLLCCCLTACWLHASHCTHASATTKPTADVLYEEAMRHRALRDTQAAEQSLAELREAAERHEAGDGVQQSFEEAARYYAAAANAGDVQSQEAIAFMHATGVGVPRDIAKAVVYWHFAAPDGSSLSQMALGYRSSQGLGLAESCRHAFVHYRAAAQTVASAAEVPGRLPLPYRRVRLAAQSAPGYYSSTNEKELLQFYEYNADMGNTDAQVAIGELFSRGSSELSRDTSKALYYFRQAAAQSSPAGLYGLGMMYYEGRGVDINTNVAMHNFMQAAKLHEPNALYRLGMISLDGAGTMEARHAGAAQRFMAASSQGHLPSMYQLALLQFQGLGVPASSCSVAVKLLKQVAEQGRWSSSIHEAYSAYTAGKYRIALYLYLKAAEAGYELAQSNAAWMLDNGYGERDIRVRPSPSSLERALYYHARSADQGSVHSLLQIGDHHFYGRGTGIDATRAFSLYQQASMLKSAQAHFNMGVMHEHGWGVPQDFHLAKRKYDETLTMNPGAILPVYLALAKLHVHSYVDARDLWWVGDRLLNLFDKHDNFESIIILLLVLLLTIVMYRRNNLAQV